ncbi:MAG: carbohydrate binding family 9 domain-containing protein [Armatimonadetes bacterium]|nr:carbohydrate binding family 9 domain-containing protein [Armatimonadota bacterium]
MALWRVVCAAFFLFFLLSGGVRAEGVQALQISAPPVLDGLLDEPFWKNASPLTPFVSLVTSKPTEDKTTAHVAATSTHLYVAFLCEESRMDKLASTQTIRNGPLDFDDRVAVYLDTYHDGLGYYVFGANPIGTPVAGSTRDTGWDAVWQVAVHKGENFWSVEMAIPFSVLHHKGSGAQTWGINLFRFQKRKEETSAWHFSGYFSVDPKYFATLTGLVLPEEHKARTQWLGHTVFWSLPVDGNNQGNRESFTPGLDVNHPFSSTLTGNLALYPDYSDVELDEQTIIPQLTERFLSEYRPFFKEGSSYLDTNAKLFRLFYSRRINRFDLGTKLTGKTGPWHLGFVDTRRPDRQDTVARIRREVGPNLILGGFAGQTRDSVGKDTTLGLDSTWYLRKNFLWTTQLASSQSTLSGRALETRLTYSTNNSEWSADYVAIGRNFDPRDGYVGYRDLYGYGLRWEYWKEHSTGPFRESWAGLFYANDRHGDGSPYLEALDFWGLLSFRNRFDIGISGRRGWFDPFKDDSTKISLSYNSRDWRSTSVSYSIGRFRDSELRTFVAGTNLWPWKKLKISLSLEAIEQLFDQGATDRSSLSRAIFFYEFDPKRTLSWQWRWSRQGISNLSLVFRNRLGVYEDLYIVLGDPNAEQTSNRIVARWTFLLGK